MVIAVVAVVVEVEVEVEVEVAAALAMVVVEALENNRRILALNASSASNLALLFL